MRGTYFELKRWFCFWMSARTPAESQFRRGVPGLSNRLESECYIFGARERNYPWSRWGGNAHRAGWRRAQNGQPAYLAIHLTHVVRFDRILLREVWDTFWARKPLHATRPPHYVRLMDFSAGQKLTRRDAFSDSIMQSARWRRDGFCTVHAPALVL